jgi:hypothetical protein
MRINRVPPASGCPARASFHHLKGDFTMTQPELFPVAELGSAPVVLPNTVPEAIAAGYARPSAENPFPWSSNLWEAFNLGQYLHGRRIVPEGFRKSRGSKYRNRDGLIIEYHYDRHGFCLTANR